MSLGHRQGATPNVVLAVAVLFAGGFMEECQAAAPTITTALPWAGPPAGGTNVTLTGQYFTGATAVAFGGVAATGVTVKSDTQITCTTPASAAGFVAVSVTTPNGTGIFANGFFYDGSTWSAAGGLATARYMNAATLLPSGKVLVAGGMNDSSSGGHVASAEVYDPATNTWSAAGSLATARCSYTATLLPNGKVLVAGGHNGSALASAEFYDPGTNTWSAAASLSTARYWHTATLLASGKVLVAGGDNGPSSLASAELYDPVANTWSAAGSLTTARYSHRATLLPSGKVLVTGGSGTSSEIYDPVANTWSAAGNLAYARSFHTATLLPSGKVLVAGGQGAGASAELYDPVANTWSGAGNPATPRDTHTATLLPSGNVVVVGGENGSPLASAELYNPGTNTWSAVASLATARKDHAATLLPSGKVLVAGGWVGGGGSNCLASAEIFDYTGGGTWSATGSLATVRCTHTATLLSNGKVLVAGGSPDDSGTALSSCEIYDYTAGGSWSAAGSLATARDRHTATLLPSGNVLVAGGENTSGILASAEIYNPGTNSWSAAGSLATARFFHTATLLPNGLVLVTGGAGGAASCELYYFGFGPSPAIQTLAVSSTLTARTVNGLFTLNFTNISGMTFSVLTTTNLALPLASWSVLGVPTELSPGYFQFTDPQLPTDPQCFYRVISP